MSCMISDLDYDLLFLTKRLSPCRKVLFHRSTGAVNPGLFACGGVLLRGAD